MPTTKLHPIDPNDSKAIKQLFTYLDIDFPRFARIPLFMLQRGLKKRRLTAYLLMEDQKVIGYSICQTALELDLLHILYIAILPTFRSQGYGGQFLDLLESISPQGILLDVEDPAGGENTTEREKMMRRIHFYQRNGFNLKADFTFNNFGFYMNIMSNVQLPQQDWLHFYRRLYDQAYGLPISRFAIRPVK